MSQTKKIHTTKHIVQMTLETDLEARDNDSRLVCLIWWKQAKHKGIDLTKINEARDNDSRLVCLI